MFPTTWSVSSWALPMYVVEEVRYKYIGGGYNTRQPIKVKVKYLGTGGPAQWVRLPELRNNSNIWMALGKVFSPRKLPFSYLLNGKK